MKHLFVPYKIASQLKEKRFDENCFMYWTIRLELYNAYKDREGYRNSEGIFVAAPLYQQVFDWLRDKHDLHLKTTRDGGWWCTNIHDLADEDESSPESESNITAGGIHIKNVYFTYDRAIEKALKLI